MTVTIDKTVLEGLLLKIEDLDIAVAKYQGEFWSPSELMVRRKWYRDLHKQIFNEKN